VKLLTALGLQQSGSEARRSVQQGAVRVNERRIEDPNEMIRPQDGDIVQVGKRKFAKIRLV